MTKYRFYICDVFTDRRFGGNPLAVLPEAEGLSSPQMQRIAREFNFSESAFVFPSDAGHTRRVRIFTPTMEVPFAGHPNVGTAFVLATSGAVGAIDRRTRITFEEKGGTVPITIERRNGIWCELRGPQEVSLGAEVPVRILAEAVSLPESDIVTNTHPPRVASVGLPFLIAEVRNRDALERAKVNLARLDDLVARNVIPDIHLYARSGDEVDIRARMFAPLDGVPEDPATGSANCALAGMLCQYASDPDMSAAWSVAQGVEMGRPSLLDVRAEKRDGVVVETFVGGSCAMVADGEIQVD